MTLLQWRANEAARPVTFGALLERYRGYGPGFDFLRLFLALSVVLWHSFQVSYGAGFVERTLAGPYRALIFFVVPAFFALSGYLVAGSMLRLDNVRTFLIFRALRIAPALAAEITLSALLLGPIVTSFDLAHYFVDRQFFIYFSNVIGIIRYHLPGVFLDNPVSGIVNGQLWTVPAELHCYIALALLLVTRLATRRWVMLAAFLAWAGALSVTGILTAGHLTSAVLQSSDMFVACFLCGNAFYLWREKIPARIELLVASFAAYAVVTYYLPDLSYLLGVAAITYATCYLGMQEIPRVPVLMRGDYSYGIYLYSYPLQQFLTWALPDRREWYFNAALAAPLAICLSMLSWHWLEKPILALRHRLAPKRAAAMQSIAPEPQLAEIHS